MGKKKHMTAGRRPGKDVRKENLEQGMAIIRSSPLFDAALDWCGLWTAVLWEKKEQQWCPQMELLF